MRSLRVAVLLATLAPIGAAGQEFQRPEGWKVRFDRAGATEADLESFVEMPPGWHVTTGPAGIFWDPRQTASGEYRVEMEVHLFDPGGRREAFGFFVGGQDLEGDGQAYTYFLIRDGGQFIVKRRDGAEAPTVRPWTADEAILAYADRGEDVTVRNVLALECGGETVRFFVNGTEVASVPRTDVRTEGVVGLRVNHRLNLHVTRLDVTPLG